MKWTATTPARRPARGGALVVAVGLGLAGLVSPSPAAAEPIPAGGQVCFGLSGSVGDAAIVNLTPLRAERRGFGLLVSSAVKADPPVAANVNYTLGSIDPNVALAGIGGDGEACFVNSPKSPVDLVADHLGTIDASAFTPADPSGAPVRVLDTRETDTPIGPGGQICFPLSGPVGGAAFVNLTPVRGSGVGYGLLISSDVKADPPLAANVNYRAGSVDPNVAVARIGADGEVCFQNSPRSTVDLVADHLGTVSGSAYVPADPSGAPVRVTDTRESTGPVAPDGQLCFPVSGTPGDAAIVNLTPVRGTAVGYGLLVSSDVKADPPVAANVNYTIGSVDPNVAVARIGVDGEVCYQNTPNASVDLVADHLGNIAGSAYTPAEDSGAPVRVIDTRVDPECERGSVTEYDRHLSRVMFGLSSAAYEIEPGTSGVRGQLVSTAAGSGGHFAQEMGCWVVVESLRGTVGSLGDEVDTEVLVARNTQTSDIAVAFRGTEFTNTSDIGTDLDARRVDTRLPDGTLLEDSAHRGFSQAYSAVRTQLENILTLHARHGGSGARVYFVGHSLGGAVATLAALDLVDDLADQDYPAADVLSYTFGAPRAISEELSVEHEHFLPNSWAIAHPDDPVTHVPSAIDINFFSPYGHVANMVLLHREVDGERVRVDRGNGRDYGICLRWDSTVFDHIRPAYAASVGAADADVLGDPTVWITITPKRFDTELDGRIQLHWDSPIEGQCDEAVLYRSSSEPTTATERIRDRYVDADGNDEHATTVHKGADYWVGYTNMFGDIIALDKYVPPTPRVWLTAEDAILGPDNIGLNWSAGDIGSKDRVVLFDENPFVVGPTGGYRNGIGVLITSDPLVHDGFEEKESVEVNDADTWWIAYIMEFGEPEAVILAVASASF